MTSRRALAAKFQVTTDREIPNAVPSCRRVEGKLVPAVKLSYGRASP